MADDVEIKRKRLRFLQLKAKMAAAQPAAAQEADAPAPGVDPKAMEEAQTYGPGGAMAEQALDTLTLGHGPEVQADVMSNIPHNVRKYLNAPITDAAGALLSGDSSNLEQYAGPDKYEDIRDQLAKRLEGYKSDSPNAIKAGKLLGMLAQAKQLAPLMGQGSTYAQAIKGGAMAGGAQGALENTSHTDDTDWGQKFKNTLFGAAGGAVLGPVAKVLSDRVIGPLAKGVYKGRFGNIDSKLASEGKGTLSDLMYESGFQGSPKALQGEIQSQLADTAPQKAELLDQLGPTKLKLQFDKAQKVIDDMRVNPNMGDKADALQKVLDNLKTKNVAGPVQAGSPGLGTVDAEYSPKDALQISTDMGESLPESAYTQSKFGGKTPSRSAQSFTKKAYGDIRNSVKDVADEVAPGLGDTLGDIHSKEATLLSSQKGVQKLVKDASNKNAVTVVDAVLGKLSLPALVAKKGLEYANSMSGRTAIGQSLRSAPYAAPIQASNIYDYIKSLRDKGDQ